jgi:hypothetical protein
MMSNDTSYYLVGDHLVALCIAPSPYNTLDLLPSMVPFRTERQEGQTPLLTLTVDDTLRPVRERQLVRKFDTGNGDTVVYQLPDGGYQFIIRDTADRNCCLLIANKDFSCCRCALNGDRLMRSFGLNDALMLAYAFAGSHHDTLLIHASCVAYEGYGYPFVAKSGTGKSTHSSLWLKHVEGAELMNDDNPVVRIIDGTPYIYGSPWSGKTPCYRRMRRPLGAIVQIDRAPENSIDRLRPVQALATLLPACSSMKWDSVIYNKLCDTLTVLIETTPIFTLHCRPDEEAARVCWERVRR